MRMVIRLHGNMNTRFAFSSNKPFQSKILHVYIVTSSPLYRFSF